MTDNVKAEVTPTTIGGGPLAGYSPSSMNSPLSSCGSRGSFGEANSSFTDKFMEALEALSPDGQQLHLGKRQVGKKVVYRYNQAQTF